MTWNLKLHGISKWHEISNVMKCWIYDPKQKHQELHTSERTIVPRTVIFLSDSVGWPDPEFSGTGVQCSCNIHWADQEAMKGNILFTSKHVANNCSLRYGCNILTDACSHTISFINTARMIIAHSLSNQNMAFAFMIERLLWHCARVKSVFATPGVILLGGHSISIFFLYKMVK